MARPVLSVCTECDVRGRALREVAMPGALVDAVKALRRQRGLKDVFKVERADCLGLCDAPCAVQLSGRRRSTYRRSGVHAEDAGALVDMACAYASLPRGGELPERSLPGDFED